jgi:hypothetical protein
MTIEDTRRVVEDVWRKNGFAPPPRLKVPASEIFRRGRPFSEVVRRETPDQQPAPAGAAGPGPADQDLARKLAWAVGSSLVIPYGRRTAVHRYFEEHADQLLRDMGLRG